MNHPHDSASGLASERASEYRWWISLSIFVLFGLAASIRYSGPAAVDRDTDSVSAALAIETLDMLLGEPQVTHPAGSKENEHVRVRLLGALNELNAQSWVLPLSNADGKRAGMANIICRVEGRSRARPLILSTHYDSSPQGPGAGDAGQCVAAILETLRVLQARPLKYELWCVFTDGEERGLWGAKDLVQRTDLPWGDAHPLVINFDARGDRGAALLYETHVNNLRAMQVASSAIAAPKVSTSLMVSIYQRLPNGTDFTPFRKSGWPGWNFAVIDGAERYHTAEDTIGNLSPRSIQHFASHAINLVRRIDSLSAQELQSIEDSEPAVFFDLLGLALIVYPVTCNWWQLCFASILWLTGWFVAREPKRPGRVMLVAGLIALSLGLASVTGWAITAGLRAADVLPRRFVNYGETICLLYPAAAALIVLGLARGVSAWCTRVEIHSALLFALLVVGAVACARSPGGAYLVLVPACVLACLLIVDGSFSLPRFLNNSFGAIACGVPALLYAPTYVLLAQAMGPTNGVLITTGVALMLLPTILAWARTTAAG